MSDAGLVKNLTTQRDCPGFNLVSTQVWNFLNGTWLELYACDESRECKDAATGAPLFTDSRMSVAIDTEEVSNEIDLACIDEAGFLLYGSCKTNQKLDQSMLTEIMDRANLFGQSYCAKVFITSRGSADVDAVSGLRDQAAARKVPIITGERLPRLREHLAEVVIEARKRAR
jgi:hypothetical protein